MMTTITSTTPLDDDSLEFGEDLFQRRSPTSSSSTSPVLRFQQQVERLASTGEPPRLTMPPHVYRSASGSNRASMMTESNDIDDNNTSKISGDQGEEGGGGKETQDSEFSLLDRPSPHLNSRPSISPMRKDSLSAASSSASSRPSPLNDPRVEDESSYSHRSNPTTLGPNLQPPHHNLQQPEQYRQPPSPNPVQSRTEYDMQDEKASSLLGEPIRMATCDDNKGDGNCKDSYSYFADVEPPPGSLTVPDLIPNDQDRWRSPTLSALDSPSNSREHVSSYGALQPPSAMMMPGGLSPVSRASKTRHQRAALYEWVEGLDMGAENPMMDWINVHQERGDTRSGIVGTIADEGGQKLIQNHIMHMKGKQHAHNREARLTHEAMHSFQHEGEC